MIRSTAGAEGMKFFPLVFSLFMFICVSNLVGIIPYTFTVSSHIIITATLALLVFLHRADFTASTERPEILQDLRARRAFRSTSCPLVVFIENLLVLPEAISHSVRLFANMLARPYRAQGVRGLVAMLGSRSAPSAGSAASPRRAHRGAHRARTLGRVPAGLWCCDPDCIYLNAAIHPGH